jgi:hypothetical protein
VSEGRRRSPRFARFIGTGAIIGFFVGAVVSLASAPAAAYAVTSQVGYFGLMGACLGALLAGILAVVIDRGR